MSETKEGVKTNKLGQHPMYSLSEAEKQIRSWRENSSDT